MNLHFSIPRVDLAKAHGFCLGVVTANPANEKVANVLGYLDGVIVAHDERIARDGDSFDHDDVEFWVTDEYYFDAIKTVFTFVEAEATVTQAA